MYDAQIQALVDEINSIDYSGTPEEVKMQKIIYLDNYIRNNIDYGIEAVYYDMQNENNPEAKKNNPYSRAYREEGFWIPTEDGKRKAVCGSISEVAKKVLNKLDIPCDFIYGHVGTFGHRWNVVDIEGKKYYVDYTASMIAYKQNEPGYEWSKQVFFDNQNLIPANFILKGDLPLRDQTLGGFTRDEFGNRKDDMSKATKDISVYAAQEEHSNIPNLDHIESLDNQRLMEVAYMIPVEQVVQKQEQNNTLKKTDQRVRRLEPKKKNNFNSGNINVIELIVIIVTLLVTVITVLINAM